MEAQRFPAVLKVLPSFADFAFLLPAAFLFGRADGAATVLSDGDTGWHIRTGEWIAAHHGIPAHDIFSFSKAGQPWFAWEWLSDILLAGVNALGGLRAVVLFSVLLLSLTYALLYRLTLTRANAIVAIMVTVVAATASALHWLARPHLFTLLFMVLFYSILVRVRSGQTKLAGIPCLAILPVLTMVWTNLHGGFVAGIVTVAAFGAGEVLELAVWGDRATRWPVARRYFLCSLACLGASLINPYFYHLHVHIAKYLVDPFTNQRITEFVTLSFHHPLAIFFEALLALAAATSCWNLVNGRFTEPLLLAIWAHASLMAGRNIEIFAIVSAPVVAAALDDWRKRLPEWNVAEWARNAARSFNRLAASTAETEATGRWHLASAVGLGLIALVLWAPNPPKKFRAEFDPKKFPAGALTVLRPDRSARIFTTDQWGDFLIWSLYPVQKVFVDGRSDFYGRELEERIADVLMVKVGWDKTLNRYGVNTILVAPDIPLAGVLKESGRWRVVYDDGVALVFRPWDRTAGQSISAADIGGGAGRDREVTKTQTRDQAITEIKSTT